MSQNKTTWHEMVPGLRRQQGRPNIWSVQCDDHQKSSPSQTAHIVTRVPFEDEGSCQHSTLTAMPGFEAYAVHSTHLAGLQIATFCTCQDEDANEESLCIHMQAVESFYDTQRRTAAHRRQRQLSYFGLRHDEPIAQQVSCPAGPNSCGEQCGAEYVSYVQVFVQEGKETQQLPLKPSLFLRSHAPLGFEWGYAGSGPSQLALAILLDFTGDEDVSLFLYQEFKRNLIAALPRDARWDLSNADPVTLLATHSWMPSD